MIRRQFNSRRSTFGTYLSIAFALVAIGVALIGATSASAASPWWHLNVSSRPTSLKEGRAKDEVQELRVEATGGEVTVVEPVSLEELEAGRGFAALKYVGFPYAAEHGVVQSALEKIYGAGSVEVQGGPGDATGSSPYIVTFTGKLADQPVQKMETSLQLFGLTGTATATEKTKGRPDGEIVLNLSNVGDAPLDAKTNLVTITNSLPLGLEAVAISGESTQRSICDEANVCSKFDKRNTEDTLHCISVSSCTFEGPHLAPFETIEARVAVAVKPGAATGGEDRATVSGGGVPSVTSAQRLTMGGEPTFGMQSYELNPEQEGGGNDTQAGSHPFQVTTTMVLNQTGTDASVAFAKDLNFKLPAGLLGNPTALPKCKLDQFYKEEVFGNSTDICPPDTAIGVALTGIDSVTRQSETNPIVIETPIYNLEPEAGEPARFGFNAGVPVLLETSVRTGGDYGVDVHVRGLSETGNFDWSQVTFWGVPGSSTHSNVRGLSCLKVEQERSLALGVGEEGEEPCRLESNANPQPFLSLPTSCTGPLASSVETDSWVNPGVFKSFETTAPTPSLDGCDRLPFSPSISVTPDGQSGSSPTGLAVAVHVPQELVLSPNALAESNVKDTTVTLPEGVAMNPSAADGLMACSLSQINLEGDTPEACPEASKVATVAIKTPLLPNELKGYAYLATQNENPFSSLVALYVVAQDPVSGTLVKLAGKVVPNPVTGQLVTTFENTPQLPFENFEIHFFGGERAPLATPSVCGAYTTTASFLPWTGEETQRANAQSTFNITSGPGGSPCASPQPFSPSLTADTTNVQAGAFSPFTMTMSRADGQQNLRSIKLHMPPGLLGVLSSVKLCGEEQANLGICSEESLIGHTIVSVGVGGQPYSVTGGKVFITGPYDGAPYGLSIATPAKAGPFDVGQGPCDCVVVRAKIEVDPLTSQLTVTSDDSGPYKIPTILDGIPLQIQHVNVTIDRPGFTFNPTSCEKQSITGALTSEEGATSSLSVPFQVTNCAALAFKPQFKVSTQAHTSRKLGASLDVKLSYPAGSFGKDANIAKVKVDLPRQLPSELKTLQHSCPNAVFEANPAGCPAASRVGEASASTPILASALSGPAYFVSYGDAKFPELVVVLTGDGVTVQLHGETYISHAGITSSTFRSIPDVPVSSFELKLPEREFSALGANANLCKVKGGLKMPTAFTAQNGLVIKQTTKVGVTGCPKAKAKKSKKTGTSPKKK